MTYWSLPLINFYYQSQANTLAAIGGTNAIDGIHITSNPQLRTAPFCFYVCLDQTLFLLAHFLLHIDIVHANIPKLITAHPFTCQEHVYAVFYMDFSYFCGCRT